MEDIAYYRKENNQRNLQRDSLNNFNVRKKLIDLKRKIVPINNFSLMIDKE